MASVAKKYYELAKSHTCFRMNKFNDDIDVVCHREALKFIKNFNLLADVDEKKEKFEESIIEIEKNLEDIKKSNIMWR